MLQHRGKQGRDRGGGHTGALSQAQGCTQTCLPGVLGEVKAKLHAMLCHEELTVSLKGKACMARNTNVIMHAHSPQRVGWRIEVQNITTTHPLLLHLR